MEMGRLMGYYAFESSEGFWWGELGRDYASVSVGAAAAEMPSSGALLFHEWARSLRRSRVLDLTTDKDILVLMK